VEETGGPKENHRSVASYWQTSLHHVVHLAKLSGDRNAVNKLNEIQRLCAHFDILHSALIYLLNCGKVEKYQRGKLGTVAVCLFVCLFDGVQQHFSYI
jgi:hypothetical protein